MRREAVGHLGEDQLARLAVGVGATQGLDLGDGGSEEERGGEGRADQAGKVHDSLRSQKGRNIAAAVSRASRLGPSGPRASDQLGKGFEQPVYFAGSGVVQQAHSQDTVR